MSYVKQVEHTPKPDFTRPLDFLALGVFQDQGLQPGHSAVDSALDGLLDKVIKRGDFKGKKGDSLVLFSGGPLARVALAVAIVGGVLWAVLSVILLGIPFLPGLIAMGVGYGAGELISLSVNRKRSMGLAWLAGGSVVGAFLLSRLTLFTMLGLPIGYGFGIFGLLFILIGVSLAVKRVRP
ncbi:MAG: hypothetical protein IID13_08510 [Candidatus Marinimicrobia bacterium]|nr:hypothetical protein [Candidatus Neomarinimicrobiota bacterium]